MFSTLGLFANLQCPQRDSCTRPNCLFSHNASSDLPPPITLRIPVDEPKVASTSSLPSPVSQAEQVKTVPAKRTVNSSPLRATGSPTLTPNEPPRKLQKLNPPQKRVVQTSTPAGVPILQVTPATSAVAIPVRQAMLKTLYDHFLVLYDKILISHPNLASEHALKQEQEVYAASNKFTYRNAVIQSVAAIKRRVPPTSISDSSVGTEADLTARAEAKKSITELRITSALLEPHVVPLDILQSWGYVVEIPPTPGGLQPSMEDSKRKIQAGRNVYTIGEDITTKYLMVKGLEYPDTLHLRHAFSELATSVSTSSSELLDVVALDCEMIYTTGGMRVARVSVVDGSAKPVFDELVRMDDGVGILDFNTRFSGITPEMHAERAILPLSSIRKSLDSLIGKDTILIGHALENDLKTLRLVHHRCVDTVFLYPHPRGAPYRRALRDLAREHLNSTIQEGGGSSGHSSLEDAIATLDLWHKEPSSGFIACSEGHILQNYRNETNEAEDVGNHMMRKRTLKSNRKKKERQSKANPKLYHGALGRYLYFQCQQLILRKQISALITLWNMPKEFEVNGVQRLMGSASKLIARPSPIGTVLRCSSNTFFYTKLGKGPSSPLPSDSPSSSSSEHDVPGDAKDSDDDDDQDSGVGGVGKKRSEEQEDSEDSEMAELMRENSESEDDDDSELNDADSKGQRRGEAGEKRRKRGHSAHEGPVNNLAVLVVACWTLRIPMMYSDIIRHITLYDLPYLDPVRLLPMEMVSHLTKHNIQALSPAHAPKTLTLHARSSRLAKQLYISYKISTPEANAAPLLWRVIQGMGGTPTLYAMTKSLSHRLSLPMVLHQSLAPRMQNLQARDPQTHNLDNAPVEASLLATVIVVLKMVYGLDGERRSPKDSNDPAFALPCIEDYLALVRHMGDVDPRKEAIFNSEKPILMDSVNDEILDEYLTFCERILLRPGEDGLQNQEQMLANYFPLNLGPSIVKNSITRECSPSLSAPFRRGPPVQGPSNTFMPAPSDITTFDSSLSTPQLSAGGKDIPISLVNSKKTWIPWRAKKSGTIKANGRHESNWTPLPPPLLHTPPPGTRAPIVTHNDPNSDSESDAYGEEDDPRPIKPVLAKPIITPASQSKAQAVLQALIQNSLISRPSSAPFVVQPGAPPYPRSSNRSRSVPSTNSLARTVLKRRMLQRLQDANPSSSEAKEIIAFSTRDTPRLEAPIDIDMIDENALSTFDHTASFSIGLRSWINRPPFEDRFSVWSVVDGNITCQRVSNTPGFALAALEFSEAIEAEADVFGDIPPFQSSAESHLNRFIAYIFICFSLSVNPLASTSGSFTSSQSGFDTQYFFFRWTAKRTSHSSIICYFTSVQEYHFGVTGLPNRDDGNLFPCFKPQCDQTWSEIR
ncbi:rexo1 protein [Lentinula edodes]|uniref:Rexo1 protein n=1 Tax=Lentinula edodes TaxID=5353 RepID=A0A1Q3EIZ5_LENED|nr:rexo1 protein [Lentinula edodes]